MQYDFGTMDPFATSGIQLAEILNQWRNAVNNTQRGSARPAFAVPGMIWIDDSGGDAAWKLMMCGDAAAHDAIIGTFNPESGSFTANASGYLPLTGGVISGDLTVTQALNVVGGVYYFGMADTAHAALRRSGTKIESVLGDQSDWADLGAKSISATEDGSFGRHVAALAGYLFAGNGQVYLGAADAQHPMLRANGLRVEAVLGDQSGFTLMTAATPDAASDDNTVATTGWVKANGGGGDASISVGVTPPGNPSPNQLWWNSDGSSGGGTLYIFFDDGDTQQWVPASAAVGSGAQPGDIKASASPNAQAGWLKADGSLLSRTSYPALFTAIGTTWNTGGEAADQFRLPDFRGRTLFGADDGAARLGNGRTGGITGAATLGATGGEQSHTLTKGEIPPPGGGGDVTSFATAQPYGASAWNIGSGGNFYNADFGYSGQTHNNVPPAAVVYWYIKA